MKSIIGFLLAKSYPEPRFKLWKEMAAKEQQKHSVAKLCDPLNCHIFEAKRKWNGEQGFPAG